MDRHREEPTRAIGEPAFAEALRHHMAGRLAEAEHQYRQIIASDPRHAEALHLLGMIALQTGRHAAAAELIGQAITLHDDNPYYHCSMGHALQAQGRLADAALHFRRALLRKPDYAEAYSELGSVLLYQGRLDAAGRAQEYAIALEPRNPLYYRRLLNSRQAIPGDRYLAAMQALATDMAALPAQDQRDLHFALGKAYADLHQAEPAFQHYLAGNALKRREFVYDEAATVGFFDRVRAAFSAELIRDRRGLGDASTAPIFIVGMPRSGTTLVEQILASHPEVVAAGELETFPQAAINLRASDHAALAFPEVMPLLPADSLRALARHYLAAAGAVAANAARFTDKMPANACFVGLIHLALPNARIIHVRRNPIDTCLSCFTVLFESGQPFSYDLAELGRYYRGYATLMRHWRRVLPSGTMLEVQYEDVVADPAAQARRIIAWCGLEPEAASLAINQTMRPVRTASAFQVRQPIYRTSVDRWRAYRNFLGPLINELGDFAEGMR